MPQPKQTTQDAPKVDAPKLSTENENPAVNDLLAFAQTVADEKAAVYEKIDANRQILRNYKRMGNLSEEQIAAIDEFYPPVSKKDKPATTTANAA